MREPHESSAGHSEGATHIPMRDVPQRLAEIPKDKEVVMICRSGGRSGHVQQHLLGAQGYTRVLNLHGGMQRWAREVDPSIRVA